MAQLLSWWYTLIYNAIWLHRVTIIRNRVTIMKILLPSLRCVQFPSSICNLLAYVAIWLCAFYNIFSHPWGQTGSPRLGQVVFGLHRLIFCAAFLWVVGKMSQPSWGEGVAGGSSLPLDKPSPSPKPRAKASTCTHVINPSSHAAVQFTSGGRG